MSIYQDAEEILAARRKSRINEIEKRYESVRKNHEYLQTEQQINALIPLLAKAKVMNDNQSLLTLEQQLLNLNRQLDKLLSKMKLDRTYFTVTPTCPKCNDSGYVNSKACVCLNKIVLSLIEQESGLTKRQLHTFSDCNLEVFKEDERAEAEKIYIAMKQYADQFPNTKKSNILFVGPSGSGKTFLIDAIYEKLISRGYSVLYSTAFTLNNIFLKYHTTFDESKKIYLDNLISCDILIIDDLGTEPILKNVTKEYLFSLINERKIARKATIVSTNLSLLEITNRYDERTASRIYDKTDTYSIKMNFKNIRNKK